MYCIIGVPRTATTYAASMIHSAVKYRHPDVLLDIEPTNPTYHSPNDVEKSFIRLTITTPQPVVKLITNHDYVFTLNLLLTKKYINIFIEPDNLRNQVLKALVCRATRVYFGDRKESRTPYVGKLTFTQEQLDQRVNYYLDHMNLKSLCNIAFTDKQLIETPSAKILEDMGLDNVHHRYKHIPPAFDDYDMLADVEDFIEKYENSCLRILGEVK